MKKCEKKEVVLLYPLKLFSENDYPRAYWKNNSVIYYLSKLHY